MAYSLAGVDGAGGAEDPPALTFVPEGTAMTAKTFRTVLLVLPLAVGGGLTVGCANRTEGQRTLEQADRHELAGQTIRRGELLVEDGKALESRGELVQRQGNTVEGDRLVAEGRAKQAQGRELIEEGRKMKP